MKNLVLFLIAISFIGCSSVKPEKELYLSETVNYTCSDKEYSRLIKKASQCITENKKAVEIFDDIENRYGLTDKYSYLGFLHVTDGQNFRNKKLEKLTKKLHTLQKIDKCMGSLDFKCTGISYEYSANITSYKSSWVHKVIPCKTALEKRHVEECKKAGHGYSKSNMLN